MTLKNGRRRGARPRDGAVERGAEPSGAVKAKYFQTTVFKLTLPIRAVLSLAQDVKRIRGR